MIQDLSNDLWFKIKGLVFSRFNVFDLRFKILSKGLMFTKGFSVYDLKFSVLDLRFLKESFLATTTILIFLFLK